MAELLGRRAFIGRGAELARLRAALDLTLEHHTGRTIVIGGEAGIGKSRLVARFLEGVGPNVRVATGACLAVASGALPYGPFVEILRTFVHEEPSGRLAALLGPGRAELTQLLPELASRAADAEPPRELDRAAQGRMFELVLGVFERLARERPLIVVIENVHWADRSTRDLIGFLARALRDDPVLLVLTTRSDEAASATGNRGFLAELVREDDVDRIELEPFDREEVAEQATSLLDEPMGPGDIDRLVARTDGNPFYVEELILARGPGSRGLPPVLRDVLAARVGALSLPARDILRAASAAGRRIDDELLAAALGLAPRALAAGLREALESGILVRVETPDGPVSEFRHAILQEVVEQELFAGERVALEAAFAEALEARLAAGDRRVSAVEIARHWDGARQPVRALPYMLQAATGAEGVYAFAEALRLWERAATLLEALPPGTEVAGRDAAELLERAADCAALVGEHRHAVDLVQRALVHLLPEGETERSMLLENRHRWHLWWSGDRAAAFAAVQAALAVFPADQPSIARARVLAQLAGVQMLAGDVAGSAACAREAIEMGERAGAEVHIALAYGVLGWDTAILGDVDGGIALFRRGQAVAEAIGSVEGMAVAATNLVALLDRVGRSEAALEAARTGYALTERYGVARTFGATLLGHAAKAELALGRWDEAERATSMGLRRGAIDAGAVWLNVNRGRLMVGLGRFDEAAILLRRARGTDERLGGSDYRTALVAAEAELAAWTGDLAGALDCGQRGLALLAVAGVPDPSLAWLAALVLRTIADSGGTVAGGRASNAELARAEAGRQVAARIDAAITAAIDAPGFTAGERAQILVALLQAELERVHGRSNPVRWREVAERWATLQRPFNVAYARLRQAEAIVAVRGERQVAKDALSEAAAIAGRLGAQPLAALVAQFARRARIALADTPLPEAGGPTDLTARENEVLQLVAAGWTNQQIASALFITRKTASVHVSNVMGKLGATNRGEAAALAQRLGMVSDAPLPVGHG